MTLVIARRLRHHPIIIIIIINTIIFPINTITTTMMISDLKIIMRKFEVVQAPEQCLRETEIVLLCEGSLPIERLNDRFIDQLIYHLFTRSTH